MAEELITVTVNDKEKVVEFWCSRCEEEVAQKKVNEIWEKRYKHDPRYAGYAKVIFS